MKIEGHGQAKILTQEEIELLFNDGLQTERDRTLFGGKSLHGLSDCRSLFPDGQGYLHKLWRCPFYN
jgi:hypothetical protein